MHVSYFLCIPLGVSWLGLERILMGMRSDWARRQSCSDWLFIPGSLLWGLL